MAPKKPTSGEPGHAPAHAFKVGDVVLAKVKGYPDWPAKIMEEGDAPPAAHRVRNNKPFLVRFYPDADFNWATVRDMKLLDSKAIQAYLDEPSHKRGNLRKAYEIALDPAAWEAANPVRAAEEEVDEDVDMLDDDEDAAAAPAAGSKKRKRAAEPKAAKGKAAAADKAAAAKKAPASKKDKAPASKKGKKDEDEPAKKKAKADTKSKDAKKDAAAADKRAPQSAQDGEKTVKGWRGILQKGFLTKGMPAPEKMGEFDSVFSDMENFEMTGEWLASTKLGKVLKKMSVLENIPRDAEFRLKERCFELMEKWKPLITKEAGEPDADAAAADLTMVAPDALDEKKEDAPAAPAQEAAAEAPKVEDEKKDEVAVEEPKANGDAAPAAPETKEEAHVAQTNGEPEAKAVEEPAPAESEAAPAA